MDPAQELAIELLEYCLIHVSDADLLACVAVSRSWRRALVGNQFLWAARFEARWPLAYARLVRADDEGTSGTAGTMVTDAVSTDTASGVEVFFFFGFFFFFFFFFLFFFFFFFFGFFVWRLMLSIQSDFFVFDCRHHPSATGQRRGDRSRLDGVVLAVCTAPRPRGPSWRRPPLGGV